MVVTERKQRQGVGTGIRVLERADGVDEDILMENIILLSKF